MSRPFCTACALVALLFVPVATQAGVFMCVDPVSGKKTFTDHACPDDGPGEEVKVEPVNFGSGKTTAHGRGTWSSDRDSSLAGTDNVSAHQRRIESAKATGYMPPRH